MESRGTAPIPRPGVKRAVAESKKAGAQRDSYTRIEGSSIAVRNPPLPAPVSRPTQQGPAQTSIGSSGVYVLSSGGR